VNKFNNFNEWSLKLAHDVNLQTKKEKIILKHKNLIFTFQNSINFEQALFSSFLTHILLLYSINRLKVSNGMERLSMKLKSIE
jgi:hypothetical protein